uniref:Uncharacterized protein n=1 Tax=Micrurus lemniscatus lemniscatus TaxID=129467 RepID=A0A2D4HJK2_MICLE
MSEAGEGSCAFLLGCQRADVRDGGGGVLSVQVGQAFSLANTGHYLALLRRGPLSGQHSLADQVDTVDEDTVLWPLMGPLALLQQQIRGTRLRGVALVGSGQREQ